MSGPGGDRVADHRGLVHRARAELLQVAVPLIAGRLDRGHHVALVLDAAK